MCTLLRGRWVLGDEPLRSLRLSGNACQDCAKRKLEENGTEVAKKRRQSGTGLGPSCVGTAAGLPDLWAGPVTGLCLPALALGGRRDAHIMPTAQRYPLLELSVSVNVLLKRNTQSTQVVGRPVSFLRVNTPTRSHPVQDTEHCWEPTRAFQSLPLS